ncbi:tail fiber assembly protein [Escherichia coli]|uniref:tail fiber assembly protein n=1 Tax=Escherichia coli TaxID=562 RepID=UPI000BE16659|nr:tail fiber assembly protein [Escherichia coli]CAD5732899.1 tail fiber assembly protein [Escherichia coli]HBA9708785.1 tail fiber assembly protein [Escherichia coli]
MELRNVTRYYPEDMPYGEGIQYFRSEDGQDFYESLDKFTKKYKLCTHPETGVIYSMAEDVSRLYPVGFTIVEVDELPEGFCIEARWYYKDGEVLPVPVDYRQLAESERARLIAIAEREISDKRTDLLLGIINDGEKEMLKLWRMYIRNLNDIDFNNIHDKSSFDSIKWPCEPENTH